MSPAAPHQQQSISRRYLLVLGLLALTYPLMKFIGFRVPRKPMKVEIHTRVPISGVLLHTEFILFDRNGATWAVSRKCTHLGCKVAYHEQGNYLECPCHQSRFAPDGSVLKGPAQKSLSVYVVEKRDTAPYYIVTT